MLVALNSLLESLGKNEDKRVVLQGGRWMISLNRVGITPDHQGKSHLCVLYSLAKAIASGFINGKFGKVLIFEQNDVVSALLQIHKDGQMKDPIIAYDKTTILVREKDLMDKQYFFKMIRRVFGTSQFSLRMLHKNLFRAKF